MCKIDLADYVDAFRDKITIWGGIPSTCMLDFIMDDKTFYSYIDSLFEKLGDGRRIILSIADTMPPASRFDRFEHILRLSREFGATK
jgi:hypothetical protein